MMVSQKFLNWKQVQWKVNHCCKKDKKRRKTKLKRNLHAVLLQMTFFEKIGANLAYRIYLNKRRSACLIFRVSSAVLIRGRCLFEGGGYLISLLQQLQGRERRRLVLSYRQSFQPSCKNWRTRRFEERTEWKSVEIYSLWTEKHYYWWK